MRGPRDALHGCFLSPCTSGATDHDLDGCSDNDVEDRDDDNDGICDSSVADGACTVRSGGDACPAGETGWLSDVANTDHDEDGCRDGSGDVRGGPEPARSQDYPGSDESS